MREPCGGTGPETASDSGGVPTEHASATITHHRTWSRSRRQTTDERPDVPMVDLPEDELFERHAEICGILCNANRLKLLHLLATGEYTVTELSEKTGIAQPTVSQHLRKMREKNTVSRRSAGTHNYYRIRDERVIDAVETTREILRDIEDS